MTLTLRIARARDTDTKEDLHVVLGLIEEARQWLATKGTDQWAVPYPDADSKYDRVLRGVQRGRTWIVWDGETAAATVTIATRRDNNVWSRQTCDCDLSERAVFVHRLITAREYAGLELGAELIDWAGLRCRRDYGAKWIRIDVWTTNTALHDYYLNSGFRRCGTYDGPGYPSGALFQKPVSSIGELNIPQFVGSSGDFVLPGKRRSLTVPAAGSSSPATRAGEDDPVASRVAILA